MPVRRQSPGEVVQSSLELHIRGPQGQVEVVPLHRQQIEHELGPGLALRFSLIDGEVRFRNLSQQPVYKDGQPLDSGRLEVGTSLEFAGRRLLLWDSGQPSAYLKGYSAPYSGEIWPLGPGQHPMGRPGRRELRGDGGPAPRPAPPRVRARRVSHRRAPRTCSTGRGRRCRPSRTARVGGP